MTRDGQVATPSPAAGVRACSQLCMYPIARSSPTLLSVSLAPPASNAPLRSLPMAGRLSVWQHSRTHACAASSMHVAHACSRATIQSFPHPLHPRPPRQLSSSICARWTRRELHAHRYVCRSADVPYTMLTAVLLPSSASLRCRCPPAVVPATASRPRVRYHNQTSSVRIYKPRVDPWNSLKRVLNGYTPAATLFLPCTPQFPPP